MKKIYSIFILFFLYCCASGEKAIDEIHMRVNSYTVDCVGEMEGVCLLVQEGEAIGTEDWEYFYYEDSIKGFDYEPGYVYHLVVRKYSVENPPIDGSSVQYELVRIISKEKQ